MAETCHCHNPVFQLLADTLLDEDGIKKTSEAMGEAGDLECQPVSVMYTGGVIRPMKNGNVHQVDAIGFHSGKVVAAGPESKVKSQMDHLGETYATIKLANGQTLLPGLIEPHVHIVATAMTMAWNDFSPFEGQYLRKLYDVDWLKGEIKRIDGTLMFKESWILAQGVDPTLMGFTVVEGGLNELYSLNCDTLDKIIEGDRPVMMLSASMHTSYVNTAALRKVYDSNASIREKYPTFDEYRAHVNEGGGLQELDEMVPAVYAIPFWQQIEMVLKIKKNFDSLFETANQRGVTLMYDAGMVANLKLVLDMYLSVERARVRIGYAQLCKTLEEAESVGPYVPPTEEFTNVYQGSVKLISDGSNQGLTGYQNETYRCKPEDNTGLFNFPHYDGFAELVKVVAEKGWPLMIHANGNKAIDHTVAAYNAVGTATGSTKRHRIEHCSLLNKSKLEEMHSLGISPSFLIGHVGYWGYAFKEAIFEEKAVEQLDLCKSALDIGMRITLHSDTSVSPLGPLRMMEQAITRIMEKDPDKRVLNENERITAEQALRAATYDAAWQCNADQWVGSLEKGKLADYVILEKDPIANVVNMRDIPVLETWVGGVKNYPK